MQLRAEARFSSSCQANCLAEGHLAFTIAYSVAAEINQGKKVILFVLGPPRRMRLGLGTTHVTLWSLLAIDMIPLIVKEVIVGRCV